MDCRKTRSRHIVRINGTESQAVGHCSYGRNALPETKDPNRNITVAESNYLLGGKSSPNRAQCVKVSIGFNQPDMTPTKIVKERVEVYTGNFTRPNYLGLLDVHSIVDPPGENVVHRRVSQDNEVITLSGTPSSCISNLARYSIPLFQIGKMPSTVPWGWKGDKYRKQGDDARKAIPYR